MLEFIPLIVGDVSALVMDDNLRVIDFIIEHQSVGIPQVLRLRIQDVDTPQLNGQATKKDDEEEGWD